MRGTPKPLSFVRRSLAAPRATAVARAEELIDFLQAVAIGERHPTGAEIEQASAELDKLLPDLEP